MMSSTPPPIPDESTNPSVGIREGGFDVDTSRWVDDALMLVRGVIRPVITLGVVGAYLGMVWLDKMGSAEVIAEPLVLVVVTFWFVDRAIQRANNGS